MLGLLIVATGCVKEDFDTVPSNPPSNLVATTTIKQLRELYGDSPVKVLKKIKDLYPQSFYDNLKANGLDTLLIIKATVTSSDSTGSFYKSVWVDDGTGGIEIPVDSKSLYSTNAFKPGQPVVLTISDLYVKRYENSYGSPVGDIQIGVPTEDLGKIILGRIDGDVITKYIQLSGTRGAETPLTVKISELNKEMIGRLIRIDGVEFASSDLGKKYVDGTLTTNRTIQDCDENKLVLRTSGYALFGAQSLPTKNGSIIGIFTIYNGSTNQLTIRSEKDVEFVNDRCVAPTVIYSQDFSTLVKYSDVALAGWTNFAEAGTKKWRGNLYNSDSYAEMTSYLSGEASNIVWLITPGVTLPTTGANTLKFIAEWHHWVDGTKLEVYISTNYDGANILAATWTALPARVPVNADGQFIWVNSGAVNLNAYAGQKVYVAFKYIGSGTQSTGYNVDNVVFANKL